MRRQLVGLLNCASRSSSSEGPRPPGITERAWLPDRCEQFPAVCRLYAAFDNSTVAVLDASAIDRPDASFDVVACRMGRMFTPEPSVAVAEIHRVLAPAAGSARSPGQGLSTTRG